MEKTYVASLCRNGLLGGALFLPTVTINMRDGQAWKFLVFGRSSFLSNLKSAMEAYASGV